MTHTIYECMYHERAVMAEALLEDKIRKNTLLESFNRDACRQRQADVELIIKLRMDLEKAEARLKACKQALEMAKGAFEHNWAIDWNILDEALREIAEGE